MTAQHTAGPWYVSTPGRTDMLYVGPVLIQSHATAFPKSICKFKHISDDDLYEVAKLISSAPDLLMALEVLADYVELRNGDNECRPLENARAAIAKARGKL